MRNLHCYGGGAKLVTESPGLAVNFAPMTDGDDNDCHRLVLQLADGTIIADSKSPISPELTMQSLTDLTRIAQPPDAVIHEIENAAPYDGIEASEIAERLIGVPNPPHRPACALHRRKMSCVRPWPRPRRACSPRCPPQGARSLCARKS